MGILSRIMPTSKNLFSNTEPTSSSSSSLFKSKPKAVTPSGDYTVSSDDDKATVFTAFMTFYYGFFGLTLLIYPSVHAKDGPFPNPLWYWDTITPGIGFGLRMLGAILCTMLMGPYIDEIFGGVGVPMKAFTQQLLVANILVFFIFLWFAFYDPIEGCNALVWQGTAAFGGLLLGWNIVEATGTAVTYYYALFCTLYFGGFALGTMSFPSVLFGPPSPVAYWKDWSELSYLMVRSFGSNMFCAFILGFLYFAKAPYLGGYCKMLTLFNTFFLGMFIMPAYFGGSSAVSSMWEIQLCVQIPILTCGLFLELVGVTGSWKTSFDVRCGNNAETFNLYNLCFFVPFVAVILSPFVNVVMGPANPLGVGMFTADLDEAALWHGRAWAITVFMIVLGPYLFGFDAVKVTKQLTVAYFAFLCVFGFSLYKGYECYNPMTFYPLAGLNGLVFLWGFYLCLPGQAGEPML